MNREATASATSGWEWPTLVLHMAVYGSFGLLTWFHAALPWWLVLPLGGYLVALHGSLQHEAVHGHPTRWPLANEALVFPSLWLWLPFRCYRETHLAHHRNDLLTDPLNDPESYYLAPEAWDRAGPLKRAFLTAHNTVLGRLVFGPAVAVWRTLAGELARFASGDGSHAGAWGLHVLGSALVLAWVLGVCGIPFWEYLLLYAYPGLSLTLLRSFLEHRAHPSVDQRSVLVEAGPVMAFLYLNNNLHALHHAEPNRAWYRLPARYRERREALLAGNGGYRYGGYGEIVARYLVTPKEPVLHP